MIKVFNVGILFIFFLNADRIVTLNWFQGIGCFVIDAETSSA